MTTVYVITANDYPDSVFSDEAAARLCMKNQNDIQKGNGLRPVYWSIHPKDLKAGTVTVWSD